MSGRCGPEDKFVLHETVNIKSKSMTWDTIISYINGLVQDCSISIANALDILQSCPKPSICFTLFLTHWDLNENVR